MWLLESIGEHLHRYWLFLLNDIEISFLIIFQDILMLNEI